MSSVLRSGMDDKLIPIQIQPKNTERIVGLPAEIEWHVKSNLDENFKALFIF
jgi:hypothetical protein